MTSYDDALSMAEHGHRFDAAVDTLLEGVSEPNFNPVTWFNSAWCCAAGDGLNALKACSNPADWPMPDRYTIDALEIDPMFEISTQRITHVSVALCMSHASLLYKQGTILSALNGKIWELRIRE